VKVIEGQEPGCALHFPPHLLPHIYLERKSNVIKDLKLIRLDEWIIKRCNLLCSFAQFVITLWNWRVMKDITNIRSAQVTSASHLPQNSKSREASTYVALFCQLR
jgi:hypothetical protein